MSQEIKHSKRVKKRKRNVKQPSRGWKNKLYLTLTIKWALNMQQQQYCCRQGVWQTSTVEYESQQSCSDKCNVPLERLQLHYALTDEATTHLKPYLLYVSVVFVQRLRKTLVDLYPSTTLSFKSFLFTLESLSSIKAVAWILKGSSLPVHSNTVFTPNYRVSHLNYCLMLMI